MRLLIGHVSPETAYLVADYPYGFRLRCRIRYWLDYKPGHGVRLVSQTSNPKRGDAWNKPKASTYCRFGGAMYLDAEGHVQWSGLTEYRDAAEAQAWLATYGAGLPDAARADLDGWIKAKLAYEARKAAAEQTTKACIHCGAAVPIARVITICDACLAKYRDANNDGCEERTIWNSDGTEGPVLICPPPKDEVA